MMVIREVSESPYLKVSRVSLKRAGYVPNLVDSLDDNMGPRYPTSMQNASLKHTVGIWFGCALMDSPNRDEWELMLHGDEGLRLVLYTSNS